jgi:hypothetical protein
LLSPDAGLLSGTERRVHGGLSVLKIMGLGDWAENPPGLAGGATGIPVRDQLVQCTSCAREILFPSLAMSKVNFPSVKCTIFPISDIECPESRFSVPISDNGFLHSPTTM